MSLGGILILAVAVISLFVFIYLVVVTARGWGVLHTLMLCFLFLECWTFMVFTAGVLDRRLKALSDVTKIKADVQKAQKETDRILYGDFAPKSEEVTLVQARAELKRLAFDRGRVWRNAVLLDNQNGQMRLRLSSRAAANPAAADLGAAPAAPAAPAATDASLPLQMVVYGFSQTENASKLKVPHRFLGEYAVVDSKNGEVVLRPTLPLEAHQLKLIQDNDATEWSLYELLPPDSHEVFAAEGSKREDSAIFGRMDENDLNALFEGIPDEAPDFLRSKTVKQYARDGQKAIDTDTPSSVWVEVTMLADDTIDVDSGDTANATVGGYFDNAGRAIDVRLKNAPINLSATEENTTESQRAKLVTLKKDTVVLLTQKAAQLLIDKKSAELKNRYYVRPLKSYEKAFGKLFVRRDDAVKMTLLYERDAALVERANQLGQAMITDRQVENQKLSADLGMFQKELSFMTEQAKTAGIELDQVRAKLVEIYRALHAEHDRIMKDAIH